MPRIAAATLTALFISASSLAQAQGPQAPPPALPNAADLQAFTEMRIETVKSALQLTPDQARLWPPIEEAIRARAAARQQRLAKLAARLDDGKERSPLEFLSERAESLSQREERRSKSMSMPGGRSTRHSTTSKRSGCASRRRTCFMS